MRINPRTAAIALAFVLLAFFLRIWRLDNQGLNGDEQIELALASVPLSELTRHQEENRYYNTPLFTLVLHTSIGAFGESDAALRIVPVAFGLVLVFLIYKLGQTAFEVPLGWYSVVPASFSAYLIYMAQYSRPHSMGATLIVASILLYWLHFKTRRILYLILGTLTLVVAFYTLLFAVFAFMAINIYVAVFWKSMRLPVKSWLASQAVFVAAAMLWVPMILRHTSSYASEGYVPNLSAMITGIPAVIYTSSVGMTYSPGIVIGDFGEWRWVLALLAFFSFVPVAIIGWLRTTERDSKWFLTLWFVVPLATMYLLWISGPLVKGRASFPFDPTYFLLVTPPYFIFLGKGLASISSVPLRTAFICGIVIANAISLHNYLDDPSGRRETTREAARFISENIKDSDLVIQSGRIDFGHYGKPFAKQTINFGDIISNGNELPGRYTSERIWLAYCLLDSSSDKIDAALRRKYELAQKIDFAAMRGVQVKLYVRR